VDVISPVHFTRDEIQEAEDNAAKIRLLYTPPHVDDPPEKKRKRGDSGTVPPRYVS
jgi:hypothetical protein